MRLSQLLEILQLNVSDYETNVDYQVEMVSIYLDLDPEIIYEWPKSELDKNVIIITQILNAKSLSEETIQLDNFKFSKMPFNKLTLGEYIDIEYYLQKPDGLLQLVAILYRRTTQRDSISEIEYEKYGPWLNTRADFFKQVEVAQVVGLKNEYIDWRTTLQSNYKGLFEQPYDEDEDEETPPESLLERQKIELAQQQQANFVWENVILRLCNSDVSRYNEILKMPIILVFNILSALKVAQD